MEEAKKQKTKKILNIVVNVIVGIILVLAVFVTINNIISNQKGYTSYFGTAFVTVETNSMDAEKPAQYADSLDGFAPGDLLSVKILKNDELKSLKEGDIVSFYLDVYEGDTKHTIINSHRIISVFKGNNNKVTYQTKGDNNDAQDPYVIDTDGIKGNHQAIGIVTGNAGGIGKVFQFFRSSTGFLVCIVVPSFLVVIYFAFNLIREIMKQRATAQASSKEQMKEEILAQLRAEGKLADDNPPEGSPAEQKPVEGETAEVAPVDGETAEQKPAESEPVKAESTEGEPVVSAPAESVPVESQSAERQSSDTKSPAIAKKPAQKKSGGTTTAKQSTNKKTTATKKSGGTTTAKQSTNKKTTATKKSGGTTGSKN